MNDFCATTQVTLQENGIIRNEDGRIIGRLVEDIDQFAEKYEQKGARAMFDVLAYRAANHYHGNLAMNKQMQEENDLILSWALDALREVAPAKYEEIKHYYNY